MHFLRFFHLISSKTVRATIRYSEIVCAKEQHCEFFNKSSNLIRGAIFYEDVIKKIIKEAKKNPSIYREDIYDFNKANSYELDLIRQLYEREFKTVSIGAAIYEVEDSQFQDSEISTGTHIFQFSPLEPNNDFDFLDLEKCKNERIDDFNLIDSFAGSNLIKKNKLKIFPAEFYKREKREKKKVNLEEDLKENGVRICFKCLEKTKLYKSIYDLVDNRKKTESCNRILPMGVYKNSIPIEGFFNSQGQVIQIVQPQTATTISAPASVANKLKLFVGFLNGRLHGISTDFKSVIPFRLIDPSKFKPEYGFADGISNKFWIASLEKLKSEEGVEPILCKQIKLGNTPDDSEDFDGIDKNLVIKTAKVKFVFDSQPCNNLSYCCFYNCNMDKLARLKLNEKNIQEIIKNDFRNSTIEEKNAFFQQFKKLELAEAEYDFLIDENVRKLVDLQKHKWGENTAVDAKLSDILEYYECRRFTKRICIHCLRSIYVFRSLTEHCEEKSVKAITRIGTDLQKNPISVILNRSGLCVLVKILKKDAPLLSMFLYSNFGFCSGSFTTYALGFVGDELCLVSYHGYIPIRNIESGSFLIEFATFKSFEIFSIEEVLKNISATYDRRPKFKCRILSSNQNLASDCDYFAEDYSIQRHIHDVEYGRLYEEFTPAQDFNDLENEE